MGTITLAKDVASCCACGACLPVCPTQAITMQTNEYGAQYPKIDETLCIQCGKCVRICGYTQPAEGEKPAQAYAAVGKKPDIVKNSASGGVFATLAECCIDAGGLVAGAVMDCDNSQVAVYHILSDKKDDLHRMQGSKYAQSEAWRCYQDIRTAIREGKTVLFSGTPCQVAAVKQLTEDPENLITIDLICHGTPPQQMLKEYIQELSKRLRGSVEQFLFRDKSCGKSFCARIDLGKKKRKLYLSSNYLSYYKYFLDGSIYRENCYSCPYASLKRQADITIGDYWGIEQFHAEDMQAGKMPANADWSCVLVNTEKGRQLLDRYGHTLSLFPTEVKWVAQNNRQLNAPSKKSKQRKSILESYAEGGYPAVESDFIRRSGGTLRFCWRIWKQSERNRKASIK